MNYKLLLGAIAMVLLLTAITFAVRQPKVFAAHKSSKLIVLRNESGVHYPAVSLKCRVDKKTYRSTYKFVPSKGTVVLKPTDFSDSDGDTLQDLDIVNNLEVTGGDSLIDETVQEEIDIK